MRRPWNIVDLPVYSLATYGEGKVNMNICTYVSAISMKPKLFMIAVYYGTKTIENLENGERSVLQILHQDHLSLVNLLGKKSGHKTNKQELLTNSDALTQWKGHKVLKGACGYMELTMKGKVNVQGDHELYWFEVTGSKTSEEKNLLMFQDLIKAEIIL